MPRNAVPMTIHLQVANKTKTTKRRLARDQGSTAQLLGYAIEDRPVDRTPSASHLPQLTERGKQFFKVVDAGNLDDVIEFIQTTPTFDINLKNYKRTTPLIISIKNEDLPIIDYLLSFDEVELGDAVLHAVMTRNLDVVERVLDRMKLNGVKENCGIKESSEFTEDITPLILAAHNEDFHMIRLFLKRGHNIEVPHPPNCFCKSKCADRKDGESLGAVRARLHTYRAIASPAYICQTSPDPILTAFLLSNTLKRAADVEREFKSDYLELSEQCSQYAVDLLDHCRSTDEVHSVLTRSEGYDDLSKHKSTRFPRVCLAVDLNQKKFIAHSNCQQLLRSAWLDGWQDWRQLSFAQKCLHIVPRVLLLPLLSLLYVIAPGGCAPCCARARIFSSMRGPFNKFFNFAASYIIFLLVLYAQSELDKREQRRGWPDTGLELPLILYILGFTWLCVKRCWRVGFTKFYASKWNIYDLVMMSIFLATFGCWVWSQLDAQSHRDWTRPRSTWHQYDPALIAECLFSTVTILAYGKLLFLFQIGHTLGPLQVSFSRMFNDIVNFTAIFIIVLISFATGIHKLYVYYAGMQRGDGMGGTKHQDGAFITLQATLKTLFWALFGLSPYQYADVVVNSTFTRSEDGHQVEHVNKHKLTEATGYFLYGLYNIAALTILLNILIAMMSNSFVMVCDNADTEWKVARTRVYIMYFDDGNTLPPPFNLLPSFGCFQRIFIWCFSRFRGDKNAKFTCERCCYLDEPENEYLKQVEYQKVMSHLTQRYLVDKSPDTMNDSLFRPGEEGASLKKHLKQMKRISKRITHAAKSHADFAGLDVFGTPLKKIASMQKRQAKSLNNDHNSNYLSPNPTPGGDDSGAKQYPKTPTLSITKAYETYYKHPNDETLNDNLEKSLEESIEAKDTKIYSKSPIKKHSQQRSTEEIYQKIDKNRENKVLMQTNSFVKDSSFEESTFQKNITRINSIRNSIDHIKPSSKESNKLIRNQELNKSKAMSNKNSYLFDEDYTKPVKSYSSQIEKEIILSDRRNFKQEEGPSVSNILNQETCSSRLDPIYSVPKKSNQISSRETTSRKPSMPVKKKSLKSSKAFDDYSSSQLQPKNNSLKSQNNQNENLLQKNKNTEDNYSSTKTLQQDFNNSDKKMNIDSNAVDFSKKTLAKQKTFKKSKNTEKEQNNIKTVKDDKFTSNKMEITTLDSNKGSTSFSVENKNTETIKKPSSQKVKDSSPSRKDKRSENMKEERFQQSPEQKLPESPVSIKRNIYSLVNPQPIKQDLPSSNEIQSSDVRIRDWLESNEAKFLEKQSLSPASSPRGVRQSFRDDAGYNGSKLKIISDKSNQSSPPIQKPVNKKIVDTSIIKDRVGPVIDKDLQLNDQTFMNKFSRVDDGARRKPLSKNLPPSDTDPVSLPKPLTQKTPDKVTQRKPLDKYLTTSNGDSKSMTKSPPQKNSDKIAQSLPIERKQNSPNSFSPKLTKFPGEKSQGIVKQSSPQTRNLTIPHSTEQSSPTDRNKISTQFVKQNSPEKTSPLSPKLKSPQMVKPQSPESKKQKSSKMNSKSVFPKSTEQHISTTSRQITEQINPSNAIPAFSIKEKSSMQTKKEALPNTYSENYQDIRKNNSKPKS